MKRIILLAALAMLLLAAPSWAVGAFVNSNTCTGTSTTATCTLSVTAGNTMVVRLGTRVSFHFSSISDSASNTYGSPTAGNSTGIGGAGLTILLWVVPVGTTTTVTVTALHDASQTWDLALDQYSGVDGTLDGAPVYSEGNSGVSYSCGTITTTNANDIIVASVISSSASATAWTADNSFTLRNPQSSPGEVADRIVSSTGNYFTNLTCTAGSCNAPYNCYTFALKVGSVSASFLSSPTAIVTGQASPGIILQLTGTGTAWASQTFTVSGVTGVSMIGSATIIDNTHATIKVSTSTTPGTLTISDGTLSTTLTVGAIGGAGGTFAYVGGGG